MDKEFFLLFSVMDENMSWYLEDNIDMFGTNKTNPDDEVFEESNKMHGNQCDIHFHLTSSVLRHLGPVSFSCSSLHPSGKWTHVREPSWAGDVRRRQSYMVHVGARHGGGHARGLF